MCVLFNCINQPLTQVLEERSYSPRQIRWITRAADVGATVTTFLGACAAGLAGLGIYDAACPSRACQGTYDLRALIPPVAFVVGCVAMPLFIWAGVKVANSGVCGKKTIVIPANPLDDEKQGLLSSPQE